MASNLVATLWPEMRMFLFLKTLKARVGSGRLYDLCIFCNVTACITKVTLDVTKFVELCRSAEFSHPWLLYPSKMEHAIRSDRSISVCSLKFKCANNMNKRIHLRTQSMLFQHELHNTCVIGSYIGNILYF